MTFSKIFLQKCSSGRVNGFSIFSGLSSNSGHPQLEPLKYISFIVPIKREDVAEWASQEAEVTSGGIMLLLNLLLGSMATSST